MHRRRRAGRTAAPLAQSRPAHERRPCRDRLQRAAGRPASCSAAREAGAPRPLERRSARPRGPLPTTARARGEAAPGAARQPVHLSPLPRPFRGAGRCCRCAAPPGRGEQRALHACGPPASGVERPRTTPRSPAMCRGMGRGGAVSADASGPSAGGDRAGGGRRRRRHRAWSRGGGRRAQARAFLDVKQVAIASIAALAIVVTAVVVGPAVGAADPCTPIVNPIACENSKPGTPQSTWDISGAGSSTIQGFATDISVNRGQAVQFKVKTPAKSYRLDIYRMGYYGGTGARQITSVNTSASLPQSQAACSNDSTTGLIDCSNWKVSASWAVPSTAVSGIYFAKLVRTDGTSGSSHIFFVVRDDSSTSAVLFQTSNTTWEAYNTYGGNSLYTGGPAGRAYKVSYDRPFTTRSGMAEDWVFNSEYPMVRWLESNGYDVSYMAGVDTARNGALIKNHKVFTSVGHDEYWSGDQRANVEAARAAGVNLAFFSGNESFWKTRWEKDSAGANYRTLVCYKETHANAVIDPADPPTWTGSWRDTRFSPPADGGRPENGMTGTLFMVNGGQSRGDSIKVPASFKDLRFWRNTSVARLSAGATKTMPAGTLGYEWDSDLDNGARPAGLIDMSNATYNLSGDLLLDNGSTYGSGPATHNLTLYRAPSGALVFGAGTVQWAWGLDANHDRPGTPTDPDMQQATVNLLADMAVQPATLQSGLVGATQSTDTSAPTAAITSPADGSNAGVGQQVTVSGTASDTGGGVVAGVEVSADNGATWNRANGTTSWSYSWT